MKRSLLQLIKQECATSRVKAWRIICLWLSCWWMIFSEFRGDCIRSSICQKQPQDWWSACQSVNPFCLPVLARVLPRIYDIAAVFSCFSDRFSHSFFQQLRVVQPGFLLGMASCCWTQHKPKFQTMWFHLFHRSTSSLWIHSPVGHVPITQKKKRLNIPASEEILMMGIIHACGQGGLDLFSCKKSILNACDPLASLAKRRYWFHGSRCKPASNKRLNWGAWVSWGKMMIGQWCRIVLKRSKAKVYPHFFPHLPFQIRQLAVGKNKGLGLLKSCMFLSKAFTRKKRYLAPGLHTRCWKPVGWKQHGVWKSGIVRQHLNETWKV